MKDGISSSKRLREQFGHLPKPAVDNRGWFGRWRAASAAEIMNEGWAWKEMPPVDLSGDIDWGGPGRINRSWGYNLHSWKFLDPVLKRFVDDGRLQDLEWALRVARSWWEFDQCDNDPSSMTWYDMSQSMRMPRLAELTILAAQSEISFISEFLIDVCNEHVRRALSSESFNAGNNHGFYAAASDIEFGRLLPVLPHAQELVALGQERLKTMIGKQFASDGGHLEHSPDYHRMLLSSVEGAITGGLTQDEDLKQKVIKAAHALGWMVQPNGEIVQIGDSNQYNVDEKRLKSIDPQTDFILSDGQRGCPNEEQIFIMPESGYAFVRSPQPREQGDRSKSAYLSLQAGFHSRAHKHADDLSLTWFDLGSEILVDSGRYGYVDLLPKDSPDRDLGFYYGSPERQYVESTRAHNTVSLDHMDIPRLERRQKGAFLGECYEVDGAFELNGCVEHSTHTHKRKIVLRPHRELVVTDDIKVNSSGREIISWFNVNGDLKVEALEGDVLISGFPDGSEIVVKSTGKLLQIERGQSDPLRGWRSKVDRTLEPIWNFGYVASADGSAVIETRFEIQKPRSREMNKEGFQETASGGITPELSRHGVFAERKSDLKKANRLRLGNLQLSSGDFELGEIDFAAESFQDSSAYLEFHSLRWLDVLARTPETRAGDGELWVQCLDRWWKAQASENFAHSHLWSWGPLLQRATTIAHGGSAWIAGLDPEMVLRHAEMLGEKLPEASNPREFQEAVEVLVFLHRCLDMPLEPVRQAANVAMGKFVRESGGLFCTGAEELEGERLAWKAWFDRMEVWGLEFSQRKASLSNAEYTLHSLRPDGTVETFGHGPATLPNGIENEALDYVLSRAKLGSPPSETLLLEEHGFVFARSGWGETERALEEETFWSMWVGPARGRKAHQDSGRITYMSRGIPWIVDIPGNFHESENHSVISFSEVDFRHRAAGAINQARFDNEIDEIVFTPQVYNAVQWTRSVYFCKTGYYLIVKDALRSRSILDGRINWILNPEVETVIDGRRVFASLGDQRLCIAITGVREGSIKVEDVNGPGGQIVGKRLSAQVNSLRSEIYTVITDVTEPENFELDCDRVDNRATVIRISDKHLDERVIIFPDGAVITSTASPLSQSVAYAGQRLAQGDLDSDSMSKLRLELRKEINSAKLRAHKVGTVQERLDILRALAEHEKRPGVGGLSDAGFSSALIDLAGEDAREVLSEGIRARARKRTPLVAWRGEGHQLFYDLPIVTTLSSMDMPDPAIETNFIWSVDLGQLVPSAMICPADGDTLMVYLHGATDRTRQAIPRYERVRSLSSISQGPAVFFSDPTLDLDGRLVLGWFLGTEDINLHRVIAEMVDTLARHYDVKRVVLVGNSGGGFSAIQIASYLDGASFISINGQTDLSVYTPRLTNQAIWAAFGKRSVVELNDTQMERLILGRRLQSIDFDVCGLIEQNTGDSHHYERHYLPLKSQVKLADGKPKIKWVDRYIGDGHIAPSAEEYQRIVARWIEKMRMEGQAYQGLRC